MSLPVGSDRNGSGAPSFESIAMSRDGARKATVFAPDPTIVPFAHLPDVEITAMAKASRRRRSKQRKAIRAAEKAVARAIEASTAAEPRAVAMIERVTDVTELRVSAADIVKAGTRTEAVRWCIARTAPQAERRIMDALTERRIIAYLPMHRFYTRARGMRRVVERPLMIGYVFVGLAPHQSVYDLRQIDGVEDTLKIDGATAWIDPWAVVQVAALERSGAFDRTASRASGFKVEDIVRVISGWATGHKAVVTKVEDGTLRITFDAGMFKGYEAPLSADAVEKAAA